MTEDAQKAELETPGELMAAYKRSEKQRAVTRRIVTLLLLAVIGTFIWQMWRTIRDFTDNRLPDFAAALGQEAVFLAPGATDKLRETANRIYPVYVAAFQRMIERDTPKLRAQATVEMGKLDAYAQQRWPALQENILDTLSSTTNIIADKLNTMIPAQDVDRVILAYGEAIHGQYGKTIVDPFQEHVELVEDIGRLLHELPSKEPDIAPPVKLQPALGMMLNLIGSELQKNIE